MIKLIKTTIILFSTLFLVSCGDEHNYFPNSRKDIPESKIKFIHNAIGKNGVNFNIYYSINNQRVSGITSTSDIIPFIGTGYGSSYPVASSSYAIINQGQNDLKIETAPRINLPIRELINEKIQTNENQYYSCFLIGADDQYSILKLNDDLNQPISNVTSYFRIINVIPNTPQQGYQVNIYKNKRIPVEGKKDEFTIVKTQIYTRTNIQKAETKDEVFLPIESAYNNDNGGYFIDLIDLTTTKIIYSIPLTGTSSFVPRPNKIYTFIIQGYNGGIPDDKTNLPIIKFYVNK